MKRRSPFKEGPSSVGPSGLSSKQFAGMFVAVCLAFVLAPLGASAAGGLTKVLITDPTNNAQQAHVDASGNLQVGGTVNVGNTPSVNVANTPTVSAQQSGTWNVGISGTPTMSVSGTPAVTSADTTSVLASGTQSVFLAFVGKVIDHADISSCRTARLWVTASSAFVANDVGYTMQATAGSTDYPMDFFENSSTGGTDTRVYDLSGTAFTLTVQNLSLHTGTVTYALVCRSS